MIEIRTRQMRTLPSRHIGWVRVEKIYYDRPASIDTWIEHCGIIAAEEGMAPLAAHEALFAQLPEIFGA